MSIVYIHGVKVRSPEHGKALEKPIRRWLAPEVSKGNVEYLPVFWGNHASDFRWGLKSRPTTPILHAGAADAYAGLGSLREAGLNTPLDRAAASRPTPGPVLPPASGSNQPVQSAQPAPAPARSLDMVPQERRADFIADLYLAARPAGSGKDLIAEAPEMAALADAAAQVAGAWPQLMAHASTDDQRARVLVQETHNLLKPDQAGLIAAGGPADWIARAGEVLRRAAVWPADALATVFAETRPVANEFVANFLGDVLVYLGEREGPGPIPAELLQALRKAHRRKRNTGEPIVLISHSMGCEISYDALTSFCDEDEELKGLEVDHWITCGCQVSFFAELRLLRKQPDIRAPAKLPRPPRVLKWTNFYDTNDLVGFIMGPVFDGVSDKAYDTGYGLALAHTGFFARPSFFQAMATELKGLIKP